MIEPKILAYTTLVHLNSDRQQKLRRLLPLVPDMDRLIDAAMKEGLAGLFYKNFLKSGVLETLADNQQEKLRSHYYLTVRFNLKLMRNFKEIVNRLSQYQVDVVLLQGMDLLQQIYDDVGLRPLTDIDLWVLEKNCPVLKNILAGLGYRGDPRYPLTFRKGSTILDIHTHILWADRIEARRFLLAKNQDHIYRNTLPTDFEGLKVRCLDRYDRIIYLSLHLLKHDAQRLIWLVDIQNLVTDWKVSDWEALLIRAKELGQTKCIAYICFLLQRLLDLHIPDSTRLQPDKLNLVEKKVLRRRIKKGSLPQWSTLYLFSSGKGLKKGGRLIPETLFPRPDILRQVFPNCSDLNPRQLYTKRIRQLLSMLRDHG